MPWRVLFKNIYIASSPAAAIICTSLYTIMAIGLWLSNLPWLIIILINILLFRDWRHNLAMHCTRSHLDAVGIIYKDCEQWQYQLQSGKVCSGKLIKARSFKSSLVLIIYIQHLRDGRYVVIPRDSLSSKNYRFLAYEIAISYT